MNDEDQITPPDQCAAAFALLAIMVDEAAHAVHMAAFKSRLGAVDKAMAALAASRAQLDADEKAAADARSAESAAISARRNLAYEAQETLDKRQARITALKKAWKTFGEYDPDILAGNREPEMAALEKAKRAHDMPVPDEVDTLSIELAHAKYALDIRPPSHQPPPPPIINESRHRRRRTSRVGA
jgi:hypothetical protein